MATRKWSRWASPTTPRANWEAAFKQRDVFGTIEAVKAVSELYSPVAGTIVEANKALEQDPALVNRDPYGKGWMVKVKLKDPKELDGLLRAEAYAKHVGE